MVVVAVLTLASAASSLTADDSTTGLVTAGAAVEDKSKWLTCNTSRLTSLFLPENMRNSISSILENLVYYIPLDRDVKSS